MKKLLALAFAMSAAAALADASLDLAIQADSAAITQISIPTCSTACEIKLNDTFSLRLELVEETAEGASFKCTIINTVSNETSDTMLQTIWCQPAILSIGQTTDKCASCCPDCNACPSLTIALTAHQQ